MLKLIQRYEVFVSGDSVVVGVEFVWFEDWWGLWFFFFSEHSGVFVDVDHSFVLQFLLSLNLVISFFVSPQLFLLIEFYDFKAVSWFGFELFLPFLIAAISLLLLSTFLLQRERSW